MLRFRKRLLLIAIAVLVILAGGMHFSAATVSKSAAIVLTVSIGSHL